MFGKEEAMKFIHISDLHLGAKPELGMPWAEAREEELWKSLERLVEYCNEEKTDLLLVSGDTFHKQPLLKELRRIDEIFGKLKMTRVVLISGNHDYLSPRSGYRKFKWHENVICLFGRDLEEIYLYGLDTTVYGFSYMESEITASLYRDVAPKKSSGIHILLAHGGDARCIPIDFKKLSDAGFDYVALGHNHTYEKKADNMYYSGILEPIDKNETGKHGFIKGEFTLVNGNYKLETEFVPFAKREYIDLHIRVSIDDNNQTVSRRVTDLMLKNGAGNLYRVFIEGIRNSDIIFDTIELSKKGMITEVIDATVLDYNYDELREKNADNIIGDFIMEIKNQDVPDSLKDRALYYGIEALLKAKG